MLYIYFSLVIVSLCLIGYIRSQVIQSTPNYVIQLSTIINKWMNDGGWIGRVSILFIPFVLIYNFFGWFVYGLTSIISVFVFILQKIWWVLVWIWNELVIAICYSLIRLIWHYTIISIWHFFKNSFSYISPSVKKEYIVHAVKSLLYIFGLAMLFIVVFGFYNHPVILIIAGIATALMCQWRSLNSIAHLLPNTYPVASVKSTFKKGLIWLGVAVGGSAALIAAMFGQQYFIVSSVAVPLTMLLLPFVITGIVFAIALVNCYPAYIAENGDNQEMTAYLKALLFRLPKLIVAIPFQALGILIVSIIPVVIIFLFNLAITQISGDDTIEWGKKILKIGNHIPNIQDNIKRKQKLTDELADFTPFADSVQATHVESVSKMEQKLVKAESLKNKIENLSIHTEGDVHYTREKQWFSIPEVPNCSEYSWSIKNNSTGELVPYQIEPSEFEEDKSKIISVTWSIPGEYTVALTPKNACGNSSEISRVVLVEGVPVSEQQVANPSGKTEVCQGEVSPYQTSPNFSTYEWELPSGATAENTNSSAINVVWGSQGGTLRVRGISEDGAKSAWKGINVKVYLLPGSVPSEPKYIADEVTGTFRANHPFEFKTRDAANDSIEKINLALQNLKSIQETHLKEVNQIKSNLNKSIDSVNGENIGQALMILGKLIVAASLVILLALLFSCAYIYHLLYNFNIYSFKQEKKHYWEELLGEIKSKNPNQPLLGIFVIIVINILLLLIAWL